MTSMMQLIEELYLLKRDLISDDYDRALARLAEEVPMTVHEVPSGTKVWTWTVPEKWTCHEAYLETMDGERLIDYADHPLHVPSYSLSFEGEVSREELFRHLHVHEKLRDAIPYKFPYYNRDWGLCATQELRDSLKDERYKVLIRSSFAPGALKIGEVFIQGEVDACFVLAAHLDHPAMANDDLSGVVVGLEVARQLLDGPKPHFSYRILFFPETLGSIAYLSQHEDLIPSMVGGLFLEMLGNDAPHALQQSFQPDSHVDKSLVASFSDLLPDSYVGSYRSIIDNDERQFNAPGVRIPMLSLSRAENPQNSESRFAPYPEYHSSKDTPEIVSQERLEASRDLVLGLLETFDSDRRYIVNHFKGEVFASGYDLWVDYREDAAGHKRLFEIMERCDGSRTAADIAAELDIDFQEVWKLITVLLEKDLVSLSDLPQNTDPHLMR